MSKRLYRVFVLVVVLATIAAMMPAGLGAAPASAPADAAELAASSNKRERVITSLEDGTGYVAGELIVRFTPEVGQRIAVQSDVTDTLDAVGVSALDNLGAQYGLQAVQPVFRQRVREQADAAREHLPPAPNLSDVYRLTFPIEVDVEQLVADYSTNPDVVYAEPNYVFEFDDTTPNDPYFSQQWHLHNTGQYRLADADIDAPEAWDIVTGTQTIVIAVIDSGVDRDHPDLDDHIWINPGETPDDGIDNDGNGYVDDTWGWNWVSDVSDPDDYDFNDPRDDNGHGTHVAGIAAAETDNGIGVAGVCWNCRVMSLKAFESNGAGTTSDIVQAIDYAANKGADVINMSFGSYGESLLLEDTLADAYGQAVLVAAAGNYGKDSFLATKPYYPASYSYVLGVGATDVGCVMRDPITQACLLVAEHRADFSNYGVNADVGAPGVSIYSTFRSGSYANLSGTSMATPIVSGLAALLLSQNPTWSKEMARGQIIKTAEPIYTGEFGRVNAYNALTVIPTPDVRMSEDSILYGDASGDGDGIPDAGETFTITLELKNYWSEALTTTAVLSTTDLYATIISDTATFGDISAYATMRNTVTPFQVVLTNTAPNNHQMDFTLDIVTNGGAYSTSAGFSFLVQRGIEIPNPLHPAVITQSMTLENDYLYIVKQNILVQEGITLTIEPGTRLQFDPDRLIKVEGTLIASGTAELPIYFTSNQADPQPGDFKGIVFGDLSTDAVWAGPGLGSYAGGSILNHAVVEYGGGVLVNDSFPYIANTTLQYCTGINRVGTSDIPDRAVVVVERSQDSDEGLLRIEGNTIASNQILGVYVFVHPDALGNLRLAENQILDNAGAYLAAGVRVLVGSSPYTVSIYSNTVAYNTGCGIYLEGGEGAPLTIEANEIKRNSGDGIYGFAGYYTIRRNLISNNTGSAMHNHDINGVSFALDFNTITHNEGANTIQLDESDVSPTIAITRNNILANMGEYDLFLSNEYLGRGDVNATYNFWGTTDVNTIRYDKIYDYWQDFEPGEAFFQPFLAAPEPLAPGFLWQASITPPDPIGAEVMTVTLDFSREMSTAISPTVTFGVDEPYTQHAIESGQWISATRWVGSYDVTVDTGDGINTLKVSGAEDSDGMEIPEDTRFSFTIQTAGTQAVLLEGIAGAGQVELAWTQTDVTDLAGYLLYRSAYTNTDYIQIGGGMLITTVYTDTDVTNGVNYYYKYSILDTDFNQVAWSNEINVTPDDYTAPSQPVVIDDGDCTPFADRLHATWSASDPESGIAEYQYSIGTSPGGTQVINWTSVGTDTEVTRSGLSLSTGLTYYINVKAQNGAGTWGSVGSSDGILVSSGCPVADFAADPTSGQPPLEVQFTDQSSGTIDTWLWEFGDGMTSTQQSPTHTYAITGTFTITLTVGGSGGADTEVKVDYIEVSEDYDIFLPLVLRAHTSGGVSIEQRSKPVRRIWKPE